MRSSRRRQVSTAILACACACAYGGVALADEGASSPVAAPSTTPARRDTGFAVLAQGAALAWAWPLAKELYARDAMRPPSLDEAHARVFAGEPPPADAPSDLRDLAETRAAIRGEDAPSRQLLAALATTFHLRGIVVV